MFSDRDIFRFKSKMGKVLPSGCIEWQAALNPRTGYGMAWMGGKVVYAHRASFIIFKGPIQTEVIRHSCDNRACVNPDHLLAGSYKDNLDDRWERGRPNKGSNHGMSVLTEQEVLEIRTSSLPKKELAKKYRVSYSSIVSILNGSRWKEAE